MKIKKEISGKKSGNKEGWIYYRRNGKLYKFIPGEKSGNESKKNDVKEKVTKSLKKECKNFKTLKDDDLNGYIKKTDEIIREYPDAKQVIESYTGSSDVNNYIINKKNNKLGVNPEWDKEKKREYEGLEEIIEKSSFNENISLYRNVNKKYYENLKVGDIIDDGLFYSTSCSLEIVNNFQKEKIQVDKALKQSNEYLVFNINVQKGEKGLYVDKYSVFDEKEFILPPKNKYIVTKIHKNGIIEMEVKK